jgi:hypothetical protein
MVHYMHMKLRRETALKIILAGLLLGLATDTLARQPILGLNFVLFTVMWVSLCLLAAFGQGRALRQPGIYAVLALANAGMVCWRAAPLVQFWSVVITLVSLGLLAAATCIDNYPSLPLISRIPVILSRFKETLSGASKVLSEGLGQHPAKTRQLNRGVVGAVILAVVFIALFASADQVLGQSFNWLGNALDSLGDFLGGYDVGRFITSSFCAVMSVAALLLLLHRKPAQGSPKTLKQSLVLQDAHTMLWTLIAIFVIFVALQLRYLFAGGALPDGLTYATYAHRGYGQLLVATLLASAVVKYVVSALKVTPQTRTKALATALVVLNGVVVLSAWKRLSLYEATYGWTLTRFVARLGLICILLGSVALVVWLWSKLNSRQLYASGWYILVGVLMCAAVLNPEGIIARKNITESHEHTVALDTRYLAGLSADSRPAICRYAGTLREKQPQTYRNLAGDLHMFRGVHNHGLSRHHTGTKAFTDRYTNCLR